MGLVITNVGRSRFAALNVEDPPAAPFISVLKVGVLTNVADVRDAHETDSTMQALPANIRTLTTAIQMTAASAARVIRNIRILGSDVFDGHELGLFEVLDNGAEHMIFYWANAGEALFQKTQNAQVLLTAGYEYVNGVPTPVVSEINITESVTATEDLEGVFRLATLDEVEATSNWTNEAVPTVLRVRQLLSKWWASISIPASKITGTLPVANLPTGSTGARGILRLATATEIKNALAGTKPSAAIGNKVVSLQQLYDARDSYIIDNYVTTSQTDFDARTTRVPGRIFFIPE